MDKEITDKISEIESLKKIEASLKEEIAKLQAIFNNLDAQRHTAQIKDEQDDKIKTAETMNKYAAEDRKLEIKRIEVEKRIDIAETTETNLKNREIEVEKREQRLVDLEDRIDNLNKQRSNFEMYKVNIEKDLVEAKEVIAQADEAFAKIANERDMLVGREVKIKEQEKLWNDEIGKLEAEKKIFEIEKENFIGLGKIKTEVVNV